MLVPPDWKIVLVPQIGKLRLYPQIGKLCWYRHANKLLQKCVIFNKAINLHSRGPTEQHFYVWELHRGCLHKVKKVCWCPFIGEGQQSHKIGKCVGTPMFYTTKASTIDSMINSKQKADLTKNGMRDRW